MSRTHRDQRGGHRLYDRAKDHAVNRRHTEHRRRASVRQLLHREDYDAIGTRYFDHPHHDLWDRW